MRRLSILAAALGLGLSAASAADLPLKAPTPISLSNGYSGSGIYWGIFGQGGAGAVKGSVPGVSSSDLTATYGTGGILVGYNWAPANSPRSYFVELEIGAQNLNGVSPQGLSFGGPLSMDLIAGVSVPMDFIMQFLPLPTGVAFPSFLVPANATAKNVHAYAAFDGHLYDASATFGLDKNKEWIFQPGMKFGMITQYSNSMAIDTGIAIFAEGNSMCFGSSSVTCIKPGMTMVGTVAMKF